MAPIIMQQNVFGITLHLIYVALYYHYLYNKVSMHDAMRQIYAANTRVAYVTRLSLCINVCSLRFTKQS